MQRNNKKNYRDITDVKISDDRTEVLYKDKGEDHKVVLEGLHIWMIKQAFSPTAFEASGQHVKRMLIALYQDYLMAQYAYEEEMTKLAMEVSDDEYYQM